MTNFHVNRFKILKKTTISLEYSNRFYKDKMTVLCSVVIFCFRGVIVKLLKILELITGQECQSAKTLTVCIMFQSHSLISSTIVSTVSAINSSDVQTWAIDTAPISKLWRHVEVKSFPQANFFQAIKTFIIEHQVHQLSHICANSALVL